MWDDPVLYDLENADDPAFDLPFWSDVVTRLRPRRVLELACGTGRLTWPVAEEIVGLDSSEAFLERARAGSSASAGPTRVSFVHGDMRAPPVAGPFDLV